MCVSSPPRTRSPSTTVRLAAALPCWRLSSSRHVESLLVRPAYARPSAPSPSSRTYLSNPTSMRSNDAPLLRRNPHDLRTPPPRPPTPNPAVRPPFVIYFRKRSSAELSVSRGDQRQDDIPATRLLVRSPSGEWCLQSISRCSNLR